MGSEKSAVLKRKRVYEYTAPDGTVFWSFTRLPARVNPPRALVLEARLGKHLLNFIADLRMDAEMSEDEDSGG